jgi:hypothetical protein
MRPCGEASVRRRRAVSRSSPEAGANERVRPIVELLGSVVHVGSLGSGSAMKLAANLALGVAITAVGEALSLAQALGLDRSQVLNMLEGSPLGPMVRAKRATVVEAAAAPDRDLRVSAAARSWLDAAAKSGAADLDFSAAVATIGVEEPQP